jgi:hypothetical protein
MTTRRDFLKAAGLAGGAVAVAMVNRVALAALPEPVVQTQTLQSGGDAEWLDPAVAHEQRRQGISSGG